MSNWFIALPVPAQALPADALTALPRGTRPMHADDLHVTVAFLGPVGEHRAERAWDRIGTLARPPLQTHVGGRAALGSPRRPSALALDLDGAAGDRELTAFIEQWRDDLCAAAGVTAERRPVRPHVTLGRPPRRPDAAWRDALNAWLVRSFDAGAMRLDTIALYTRAESGDQRRFRRTALRRWTDGGQSGERQE